MSSSASIHSSSYQSRNSSTTTVDTCTSFGSSRQRSSPIDALARLRFPSSSSRRKKAACPPEVGRKESTMSMYSDATTCDPIPSSPSEVTLAHSFASSDSKSLARSLVHRSSRMFLRRKTSKASMVSSLGPDSAPVSRRTSVDSVARPESKQSMMSFRTRPDQSASPCRPRISQPYDFQHVAHTAPVQAISALRQVSPTALQTEFHAMQAVQTPSSELKHIDTGLLRPMTSDGAAASTHSPASAVSSSSHQSRPLLRSANSSDSFKRQSKSFSQPFFTQGPMPPPRRSSRKRPSQAAGIHLTIPGSLDSPTLPGFNLASARPRTAPSSRSPLRVATSAASTPLGMTGVVHAVTTPDDSACVLLDVVTPLADVPEEEVSSFFPTKPIHSAKSSADLSSMSDDGPPNRMLRSGSDPVLPESAAAAAEEIPDRTSRRISTNAPSAQSWEDDIDYCYEHALEAESNADPLSPTSPVSDVEELVFMKDHRRQVSAGSEASVEAAGLAPVLPLHLQESLRSTQIRSTTLQVPSSMLDAPLDSAGNVMFTLSPSMVIPREYSQPDSPPLPSLPFEAQHAQQVSLKSSRSNLPLFTPSMGDLSKNYSSPRSSVTASNSSVRDSDLMAGSSASMSTTSIPDLVSSGKNSTRKSVSTRNSVNSQSGTVAAAPTTTDVQQGAANKDKDDSRTSKTGVSDSREVDDILSEMPIPPKRTQPLRARAKSESASRATAQSGTAAAVARPSHARSASSAVATTSTSIAATTDASSAATTATAAAATTKSSKPTYSLFPPLDRIGAAPPARA